uniref:AP_endonuc_2 domain-containing protein n=1 Tax=Panagrellus redivivus TaxID=6233 RepID=A0A7E4ZU08_PANRE
MPPKRGTTKSTSETKPKRERKTSPVADDDSGTEVNAVSQINDRVHASATHSKKLLGAHVSAAGGVENALTNAAALGCRSLALFLRNQRRWVAPAFDPASAERWKAAMASTGIDPAFVVPHGSYLLNPASPNPELREKSAAALLDEIQRCEQLGITLYNIHPGSTTGKCTVEESIEFLAGILDDAIEKTEGVTILIETMAGQGSTLGGTFEEIRAILDAIKPANADRVAVCLDTCHIFAGGYDIRTSETYEATMAKFEEVIGFDKLKAVHVNDSKSDLNSHLDRHEHIAQGKLADLWPHIMADPRFDNIPMILETPEGKYSEEMMYLYGLDPGQGDVKEEVKDDE